MTIENQTEWMAKVWISVWVRLNRDVAEVMLVTLIQLPAEEETFGVAGGMRLRYKVLIRPRSDCAAPAVRQLQ